MTASRLRPLLLAFLLFVPLAGCGGEPVNIYEQQNQQQKVDEEKVIADSRRLLQTLYKVMPEEMDQDSINKTIMEWESVDPNARAEAKKIKDAAQAEWRKERVIFLNMRLRDELDKYGYYFVRAREHMNREGYEDYASNLDHKIMTLDKIAANFAAINEPLDLEKAKLEAQEKAAEMHKQRELHKGEMDTEIRKH